MDPSSRDCAQRQSARSDLSVMERILLRLSSTRSADGVLIATDAGETEAVLERVGAAIALIKARDPLRHRRMTRDLDRVWVRLLPGVSGSYRHSIRTCQLDTRFVLAETTSVAVIAATILHEATHARLMACGFDYAEGRRQRIEAICLRREIAFARTLPDGREVRERAEWALEAPAATWADESLARLGHDDTESQMRHLRFPPWLMRCLLAVRDWRLARTSRRE